MPARVKLAAGLLLVLGSLIAVVASPAASSSSHARGVSTSTDKGGRSGPAEAGPGKTLGKLPVRFEANVGQTDPEVEFLARGSGYTVFLTRTAAVLSLARPGSADVVRLSLAGGNEHPELVGLERLEGHSNYYGGSDPSQWHEGVATYGSVAYRNAYPGIDLVFHGEDGQVKFDFVVAPGAEPGVISVQVDGAELTGEGEDLLLTTPGGAQVRKPSPVVYQDVDGARRTVTGSYVLEGDRRFGFQLGSYDPAQPLVIDPELAYSFTLEGKAPYRLALDPSGSAYIHGETASATFPGRGPPGTHSDVFVAKLTPDGSSLVYATFLGGPGAFFGGPEYWVHGLAVYGGRAYVVGETVDDSLPLTGGGLARDTVPPPACPGGNCHLIYDGFLVRLEADGRVTYGTYLQHHMRVRDVAVNAHGVFLAGNTQNMSLATTSNAVETSPQGEYSGGVSTGWGFVAHVVPGSDPFYRYLTYFGANLNIKAIAVDDAPSAHITGTLNWFEVSDPLPDGTEGNGAFHDDSVDSLARVPVKNAFQSARRQRQQDMFVAKMNTAASPGASLVYSTYLGGSQSGCGGPAPAGTAYACQGAMDIAVHSGKMYVTGFSRSTDFPTTGLLSNTPKTTAFQPLNRGESDAYLSQIDPSQSGDPSLVYSTYLGGEDLERAYGIAVASPQAVTVTGWTRSTAFPVLEALPGQDTYHVATVEADGVDGFVTTLDVTQSGPQGLVRSTFLGGTKSDHPRSVAVDPAGDLYLRGSTRSTDFPSTQAAFDGGSGSFVTKVDVPCPVAGTTPTPPSLIPGAGRAAPAGMVGFGLIDGGLSLSAWATAVVKRRRRRRDTRQPATPPGQRRGRRGEGGFTLMELLVVVVILGILAAVAVFATRGAADKGQKAAEQTDERIIRTALETYCAQNGRYPIDPDPVPNSNPPIDKDAMDTLVEEKYLASRSGHHLSLATGDMLQDGLCPGTPSHYELNGPPSSGTLPGPPPIKPCP